MATIQFHNGYSWNNLPPTQAVQIARLDVVIERLKVMREEWQEGAYGENLLEVRAPVGLLLLDFCALLELTFEETKEVLGVELAESLS